MNAQTGPVTPQIAPKASDVPEQRASSQSEDAVELAPPSTEAVEAEKPATPLAESRHAYARRWSIRNWRDFFVQIAVVAIGLLLALGLEQVVQSVHDQHQRAQLEEQMQETFAANSRIVSENLQVLEGLRAHLTELRAAADTRDHRRSTPTAPAVTDPRNNVYAPPPRLGPYEASKANGTVALLSLERIRLYDRIEFTHSLMLVRFQAFMDTVTALRAFGERFDSAPTRRYSIKHPDLSTLSTAQQAEYQALIGNAIEAVGAYAGMMRNVDAQSHAVLNGARDESELMEAVLSVESER